MKSIRFLAALACFFIFMQACQKDHMPKEIPDIDTSQSNISLTGEPGLRSFAPPDQQMVLGQKINNPYSVANMTAAWNNLYDPDYVALPATDLYVRFLPANLEELKLLFDYMDSLDIDLDDYPLDYEIIQEGTWYHDPSIPEDEPTWYYTVVKPDFVFPPVQYEILEDLVLTPYYALLTAEAFRITGNEYDDSGWERGAECHPECPSYPCCYLPEIECWDDNRSCNGVPCVPGSPTWPDCLEDPPPPPSGDPWVTTECGCKVSSNPLLPSGCVQVEDTQLGPEGVRNLKVVVKDGLFKRIVTETDENGCWHVSKAHGGRVKIKLKFKNDKIKARAIRKWGKLWQYGEILKHKVILQSPPYNNIHVLFGNDPDLESKERALWYAATANNAIFEFNAFAQADYLTETPETIDLLITKAASGGAAPMFDEMSADPMIFAGGTLGLIGLGAVLSIWGTAQDDPEQFSAGALLAILAPYLVTWAPDVVINHGGHGLRPSDQIKNIMYHEYAHSAHWNALNDNNYWIANAFYIAENMGYGDGTANGAGRCGAIEMWGYHIGPTYADAKYGINHSNATSSSSPVLKERTRHIYKLESYQPSPAPTPEGAWIPAGLFRDCVDDNSLNPPNFSDPAEVGFDVKGYSNMDCLNAVVSGKPTSLQQVKNNLNNILPAGVTSSDLDLLFESYGF